MNETVLPKCPNCHFSKYVFLKYPFDNRFKIYFCKHCQNGFTYPVPKDISKYYHSHYWISPGPLGIAKRLIFILFHKRRKNWVQKYLTRGEILEIGAGEGNFIKSLGKNFRVTGIELPKAEIKNKKIMRIDYLKWKSSQKFDAVIFWESLEHVSKPQEFLKKSHGLLKRNGLVFIELPRFNCLESRIFKNSWFHLDPPRHLVHLTNKGLEKLLLRTGFKTLTQKSTFAYEYTIWGFLESVLSIFGIKSTDYFKKNKFPIFFVSLLPLFLLSFFVETLLILFDQSPIRIVIAKKKNA